MKICFWVLFGRFWGNESIFPLIKKVGLRPCSRIFGGINGRKDTYEYSNARCHWTRTFDANGALQIKTSGNHWWWWRWLCFTPNRNRISLFCSLRKYTTRHQDDNLPRGVWNGSPEKNYEWRNSHCHNSLFEENYIFGRKSNKQVFTYFW